MGMLKLPKGFLPGFSGTKKPIAPARIDWSDPLSHGLSHYFLFNSNEIVDLVSGKSATRNGAVWTPDAMSFDEVNDYITVPNVTINGRATILSHPNFADNAGSNFQYWFSFGEWGGFNSINIYLNEASAGGPNTLNVRISGATTHKIPGYFPSLNNLPYALTGIDNNGTGSTLRQYVDGIRRDANDAVTRWPVNGTTRTLYIGAREDLNADRFFGGTLTYLAIYNSRALSAAEIAAFHRNPYQILKPANDLYYFTASADGGGAIELTPSNGVINAVGNTPVVTASLGLSPSNGVVNVVGNTPTVTIQEAAIELTPSNGVINVTGNTPTIGLTVDLAPQNGRIDVVGNTPEITRIIDLRPDNGAVNVNGNTPTISVVNGTSELEPSTGRIDAVGNTPVLTQLVTLQPESGLITVTGNTPSISIEADAIVLSPSSGKINVSGNTPTVSLSLGGLWSPVESASGTWSAVTQATGTWQRV